VIFCSFTKKHVKCHQIDQ